MQCPITFRSPLNSFTLVAVKKTFSHTRLAEPLPPRHAHTVMHNVVLQKVAVLELVGNALPSLSLNPLPCRSLFNVHSLPILAKHILRGHCWSLDSYGVQVELDPLRRSFFCKRMLVT